jgi:hypothetical protein
MPRNLCNCLISGGRRQESIAAVCLAIGIEPAAEIMLPRIQSWNCKNTLFQIDGKVIGGQDLKKCFEVNEVYLPIWRADSRSI